MFKQTLGLVPVSSESGRYTKHTFQNRDIAIAMQAVTDYLTQADGPRNISIEVDWLSERVGWQVTLTFWF